MRKLFLICLLLVVCTMLFNAQKAKSEVLDQDELEISGFSKYMTKMTLLQRDKHEGIPYQEPGKVKHYMRSVFLQTNLAAPTQAFGFYDISPSE